MFGLAFLFTKLLQENSFLVFLGFLLIFNGIMVYAGMIDSWTMILTIIIIISLIYYKRHKESGSE